LQQTLQPLADVHASADYRRRVAGALAARVIAEARDDAMRVHA
jgi:CO/xanthine dehydrogenase FAD-binding subunit